MVLRQAAVVAFAMLCAQQARAQLVYDSASKTATETYTGPSLPTELTGLSGHSTEILVIDRADNNFFGLTDTITKITVTVSGVVDMEGTVMNQSAVPVTGSASAQVLFGFVPVDIGLTGALGGTDFVETASTNTASVPPGQTGFIFGSNALDPDATTVDLPSALFPSFEFNSGGGVFEPIEFGVTTSTTDTPTLSGGGVLAEIELSTDASATLSVVYHYEPRFPLAAVPESPTWAMLLAGFASLGWVSRRRAGSAALSAKRSGRA